MWTIQSRKRLTKRWQEFRKRFAIVPTWRREFKKRLLTAPLGTLSGKQKKACSTSQPNFAAKIPLRQQCPPSTENQRNSDCLKICSEQVWKSTIILQKRTKETISILSCMVMHYKHPKTSLAPTERSWENFWQCCLENTWNLSQRLQKNTNFNDWSSIQRTTRLWIFYTNKRI